MALRALIVDDNAEFLEVARALLERQGMTVVAVATTSEEALHHLEGARPDLLLVDIDLGAESGIDLANRIVEDAPTDPPPVVLISSYPEDDVAELIEASSAIGFLSKSSLSAAAIDAILRRQRP